MNSPEIRRVAVVATGVIGAGWVTAFLARGMEVVACDPAPGAEQRLRDYVAAQWPSMESIGLAEGASPDKLRFTATLGEAVRDAQFVQENGPEDLGFKRELFRQLDELAPAEVILATSSSSIIISDLQTACSRHPERVVLGHPFNPPHLIPLVEVAGGCATSAQAIALALDFYRAMGKHPIHLRKEVLGHVANRLQAALWQEAFHLVATGVASVSDIDAAIAHGPGLRWALLGPFLNLHLSGGAAGLTGLLNKPLWQATEAIWRDLGRVSVGPELAAQVAAGIDAVLASHPAPALLEQRDATLLALLKSKCQADALP